ncbi:MAG: DUF5693 family protein [Armatimonadota bacterium]|nr:DUF5693 family protein [Armatimonadota bacterium]MDR7520451.1 DUF5693 family protein [Armatimonadota bacterium]MDR7550521.1 DUF5693 family protein [Armatimonadota bacterium]
MRFGLLALVLCGLMASVVVLGMRVRLETRYRAVEIVLDGDDWIGLARREGRDPVRVLQALRQRGAVSVALGESTLKRLAEEGIITYAAGGTLAALARLAPLAEPFRLLLASGEIRHGAVYVTGPPEDLAFVHGRLRILLGEERVRRTGQVLEVLGTPLDVEELGLGFRPQDARFVRAAGLGVVLRARNYRGLTPQGLRMLADSYAQAGPAPTLIFALTEVQGFEGLLDQAAGEYRRIGARFGRIEVFTARRKQRGEDRMTALMRPDVIRVFSITPEELIVLRPDEAADRFVRAAQERNIRLLYVRPLLATPAGEPALDANLRMVELVARALRSLGFATERSRPMPPLEAQVPRLLPWLVALGAASLSVLVLADLAAAVGVRLSPWWHWVIVAAALCGTVAAGFTAFDVLWRQVLALGVAAAGAAGAAVWALRPAGRPGSAPAIAGYLTLARAVGLAAVTGFFVAALLSQWSFMLAFSTFLGVKAAHVGPVLLVALWLALDDRGPDDWRTAIRELRAWISQPLRVGSALLALVVGVAAVMLLARTGNVSVPLPELEQRLRTTLEEFLVARPRTKEFLVGYPALVLAGTAASLGWRRLAVALALAGTVGTTGAINSFSHLHTPLVYTVWRTANALALGALLAVPGVVVLLWIARRLGRS